MKHRTKNCNSFVYFVAAILPIVDTEDMEVSETEDAGLSTIQEAEETSELFNQDYFSQNSVQKAE